MKLSLGNPKNWKCSSCSKHNVNLLLHAFVSCGFFHYTWMKLKTLRTGDVRHVVNECEFSFAPLLSISSLLIQARASDY